MTPYIPVVLGFDSNYADYAAVATFSAYKNSSSQLKPFWLFPADILPKAEQLRNHLRSLNIEVELLSVDSSRFAKWKETIHITRGTYLRLLAPDLIDEQRIIYLDCDVLVLSDLGELYLTGLDNSKFAGVVDSVGAFTSRVPRASDDVYINAGVLMMDLAALRKDGFLRQAEKIYEQFKSEIVWADQCIINKYAEGNKTVLDPKWNRMVFPNTHTDRDFQAIASPSHSSIIHFLGNVKPWHERYSPLAGEFWWQYANEANIPGLKARIIKRSVFQQLLNHINQLSPKSKSK